MGGVGARAHPLLQPDRPPASPQPWATWTCASWTQTTAPSPSFTSTRSWRGPSAPWCSSTVSACPTSPHWPLPNFPQAPPPHSAYPRPARLPPRTSSQAPPSPLRPPPFRPSLGSASSSPGPPLLVLPHALSCCDLLTHSWPGQDRVGWELGPRCFGCGGGWLGGGSCGACSSLAS